MSLKNLKLSNEQKQSGYNPLIIRRQKLLTNIDKQIRFIESQMDGFDFGKGKPSKWYWVGEDSQYRCSIYYGKKPIELEKGKFSFLSTGLDKVKESLELVKGCVVAGDFDEKIEVISKNMRKNFKK